MQESKLKDLIIIGGGPAGVAAAIYASRGMIDCIVLDAATLGGQLNWTETIENYPGYVKITGFELIEKFRAQLDNLNVEIKQFQEIQDVSLTEKIKVINTLDGSFKAKTVLICTGANPKKLNVPGEKEYTGKGVSYCAVCDGAFFKGKEIAIIGGGNSAIEEGLYLTRYASKVTVIHRRNELRASKTYQEKILNHPKTEFIWDSVVEEVQGNNKNVTNLVIKNVKTGEISNFKTDGVFPYIGSNPNTELFKGQITLDKQGYILTDETMATNILGVYAAGDVRKTTLRQLVVSASDGAIAATEAIKYIDQVFKENSIPA